MFTKLKMGDYDGTVSSAMEDHRGLSANCVFERGADIRQGQEARLEVSGEIVTLTVEEVRWTGERTFVSLFRGGGRVPDAPTVK